MGLFTRQNRKALESVPNGVVDMGQNSGNAIADELKNRIHRHVIERIDLARVDALPREAVERQIRQLAEELLTEEDTPLSHWERNQIILEVQHENEVRAVKP